MNIKKLLFTFILLLSFVIFCLELPSQIFKTSLQVIIRDELGNTQSQAKVRLFKSKEDYDKLTNAATATLETDEKGKVTFKDLEPIIYYVNAEKGSANNFGAGEQTTKLEENRLNKLTIVISE